MKVMKVWAIHWPKVQNKFNNIGDGVCLFDFNNLRSAILL